jgi:hypothetical protein
MTGWCFALVNSRLAEMYFDRVKNHQPEIWAHCYVKKEEFKTKTEQKQIAKDIEHLKIVHKNKKYYRKTDEGLKLIFPGKLPESVKEANEALKQGKTSTFAQVKKKLGIST